MRQIANYLLALAAVAALAGAMTLSALAQAQQCVQRPGAANQPNQCGVRAGPDIEELLDIASAQGCRFRCDSSSLCRAWTYVIEHKVCHLKGQALPVAADNCCSTGIRLY